MSGGPDFICIGAEKAGTTWLHDNLRHHPDMWLPPPPHKELNYFNNKIPNARLQHLPRIGHGSLLRRYSPLLPSPRLETLRWLWRFNHHRNDSAHWYRSLFMHNDRISGDITPLYSTLDDRGVTFVRQTVNDDCKTILILRDPVSRYWSSIKMLYRYRKKDIRPADTDTLLRELSLPYMSLKSDYPRMINTWRNHFSREQFGIFYFDDLVRDNRMFLDSICEFIGADSSNWTPPALNKRSNRDKQLIKMPDELNSALSKHFLSELNELSDMLGGHATTWFANAQAYAQD